jgi:hypothetical protein
VSLRDLEKKDLNPLAAFQLACIAKHITNNKQNIVILELKTLSGPGVLDLTGGAIVAGNTDSAYLPYLLQLSHQTGMIMTQPLYSQPFDNGPAPMGCGLL